MESMKVTLLAITFLISSAAAARDSLQLSSPAGNIAIRIWKEKELKYLVRHNGKTILGPSTIDMLLDDGKSISASGSIQSHSLSRVRDSIISPVPEKRRVIRDNYNQVTIRFSQPFSVAFRAYDDGVAYRIITSFRDSIIVRQETASFHLPGQPTIYFPVISKRENADIFHTSFEELYRVTRLDSLSDTALAYSPVLVAPTENPKIAIIESDLDDYPGMFLQRKNSNSLDAVFAPYPLEEKVNPGEFPQRIVTRRAEYIARTSGNRTFPWRIAVIAKEDRELASTDIVYRLGAASKLTDPSWIKPGKGTDEWIIGINLFNVPFRAGINTATYKYYIDFAKRFGFQRIMLDAGWSDNSDLFAVNAALNMDSLSSYARENGIRLSMWTLAMTLDRQLDSALRQFKKWGVDFVMTDFIDRDDQLAVRFYHRMAKAFADQKIMLMFHGAFAPKGLNRTYPNVVSTEGVLGSEYNIWSDKVTPDHDLVLPFTRMLAGPMDYEPGILNNATRKGFRANDQHVASMGTRCHQLAMFLVYDNPVPIFSGNPSQAHLEPAFMELLGSIPTTWDETKIIDARVGQYILTARKKGKDWYVGGMNDWTQRDADIKFDFLEDGTYQATLCQDGINSDRYPADYQITTETGTQKNKTKSIRMAPGGGFLLRLTKQ
ncbi:alpha-glucosidase [Flavihumibacter solisilvae]|uniref:Alpha-glucosidase n=2 Tax=Flavihumibacter solisilvae TaxID=1349421 RepID=A0A0C1LM13_9BACT|nr:alpha-glucosidase [Flavihumibacter solisilvae]